MQRAQDQVAQQQALAVGCSVVGIKSRIAPSILKVECKSAWRPVLPTVKKKNTKPDWPVQDLPVNLSALRCTLASRCQAHTGLWDGAGELLGKWLFGEQSS